MSTPSQWPLPDDSHRYVVPDALIAQLDSHRLACELYPLAFGYYRQAAGHHMHRERHSDHLLIYCVAGEGFVSLGEQPYRVRAGDLLLLPAGAVHRYAANPDAPWSIHWVHYAGQQAEAFNQQMGFTPDGGVLTVGPQPRLVNDFEGLLGVQETGYRAAALVHTANRLRQLLSGVPLYAEQHAANDGVDVAALDVYMREHLDQRLSLRQLADLVGLSPAYFATVYRRQTGVSPIQHFINLKIERACQMLDSTSLSISDISQQLGYDDRYYFSRLFRRTLGTSPRAYRLGNR